MHTSMTEDIPRGCLKMHLVGGPLYPPGGGGGGILVHCMHAGGFIKCVLY